MNEHSGITENLIAKLMPLGFRPSEDGLRMVGTMEDVKISCLESPEGIHLFFMHIGNRSMAQAESKLAREATAQEVAAVIVSVIERDFSHVARKAKGAAR